MGVKILKSTSKKLDNKYITKIVYIFLDLSWLMIKKSRCLFYTNSKQSN